MKKIIVMFFMASAIASLSSCYKKFDPASYQPPFTINGYSSVDEIGAGSLVGYWSFDGNLIDEVSNIGKA